MAKRKWTENNNARQSGWALPPRTQPRRCGGTARGPSMRSRRRRAPADPRIAPRWMPRAPSRPHPSRRRRPPPHPRRVLETTSDGASTAAAPFAVASLAAAAAAATGYVAAARDPVRADAASQTRNPKAAVGSLPYDRAQSVADWLLAKGATLPGVHIRPVDAGRAHVEEHGMGLYPSKDVHALEPASSKGGGGFFGAGRGAGPVTLASVPLALALTSKGVRRARSRRRMLPIADGRRRHRRAHGGDAAVDTGEEARGAIARGAVRRGHPRQVPHPAALLRRRDSGFVRHEPSRGGVATAQDARLGPSRTRASRGCEVVSGDAGVGTGAARVVRSDVRRRVHERSENHRRRIRVGVLGVLVSRALAADRRGPHAPTVEAIVPGIDFANHSCGAPNARWEVRAFEEGRPTLTTRADRAPRVELLGEFGSLPAPGEEVVISYGDKTNEELLFVHGFADRDNPRRARAAAPWAVDEFGEGGDLNGWR